MKTTLKQTCLEATSQAPDAFKDLMIHVLCNSHGFSHFAAFFIDTRAKISVVISWFHSFNSEKRKKTDFNQSIKNRKVIKIHQASTTCFFHQSILLFFFQSKKERRESEITNNHPNQMNEKKWNKCQFHWLMVYLF